MKKRKFFLGLMITEGILFALCCASIIFCVLNGSKVPADKQTEHTMAFVFLFLHMIAIAVFFFYSLKAYLLGSSFLNVITVKENGERNKKQQITFSIIAGVLALIAAYFIAILCGADSFGKIFSLGLQVALVNLGITLATMALFIVFYKPDQIS